jgi:hypothetical protein
VAAAGKNLSATAGKFEPADVADQQMRLAAAADTVGNDAAKLQSDLQGRNAAGAGAARTTYDRDYFPKVRACSAGLVVRP